MKQNFREKYIPKSFSEFVGNVRTIRILKNIVKSRDMPKGIIFHGPPGSGKTSLTHVFIKALHCQKFSEDVCGKCKACVSFDRILPGATGQEFHDYIKTVGKASSGSNSPVSIDYAYYDCSRMSPRALEDILQSLRYPSYSSTGKRIINLDEFDRALSKRMQDQFLTALEKFTDILLIFCLIDLSKVHEAFRQRVTVLKTNPPEIPELTSWLAKICSAEGIIIKDNGALEQVAKSAKRLPRGCLAFLEKVALLGEPLSTSLARELAEDNEESKYTL